MAWKMDTEFQTMAWKMVVALILVAVGLTMAGIIYVLWHHQGERYQQWLEGEGARGTEEQGW